MLGGIKSLEKYRSKKAGYSLCSRDNRWVIHMQINKIKYQASFKTEEEAKVATDDINKNGIERINKYKKDRYKYKF